MKEEISSPQIVIKDLTMRSSRQQTAWSKFGRACSVKSLVLFEAQCPALLAAAELYTLTKI